MKRSLNSDRSDPVAKPKAELRIYWSKSEKSLMFYGTGSTGGLMHQFFDNVKMIDAYGMRHGLAAKIHHPDESDERSLAQELDARGYDLTTLRFQIRKKPV